MPKLDGFWSNIKCKLAFGRSRGVFPLAVGTRTGPNWHAEVVPKEQGSG